MYIYPTLGVRERPTNFTEKKNGNKLKSFLQPPTNSAKFMSLIGFPALTSLNYNDPWA